MLVELFSPILFLLVAINFVLWFYFQEKEKLSKFFSKTSLSLLFIHVLFLLVNLDNEGKFQLITRDIMLIGSVGLAFMILRLLKISRHVILLLLVSGIFVFYKIGLKNAYTLDHNALSPGEDHPEFLIEIPDDEIDNFNKRYGKFILNIEPAFFDREVANTDLDEFYTLNVKNDRLEDFLDVSSSKEFFDYIESNEIITIDELEAKVPTIEVQPYFNDPLLSNQWALESIGYAEFLDVLRRHKKKPKKKTLLAILDTGVDGKHEDLKDNLKQNSSKHMRDKKGHGTHCAGIAGAVVNNGLGVASPLVNSDLYQITSVKVLSDFGSGTQAGIIKGMIEAVDMGADVISMSLGGFSTDSRQRAYSQAVEYASKKGVIVVVAAGNAAQDARKFAPANSSGVICVAAIDEEGNLAKFSNQIEGVTMGVYAPGTNIMSTYPGNEYKSFNGTSMATPYVSALVAILKSYKPDLTTQQVHEILEVAAGQSENSRGINYGKSLEHVLR